MGFNDLIEKLKKSNDPEKLKSFFNVNRIIEDIKTMELKKFWRTNNKMIYFILEILVALIILLKIRSTAVIHKIMTDLQYSAIYFGATLIIFSFIVFFYVYFYFKVGIKQDYNTDEIMRRQMKYKGVDWHREEELLKKPDERD